jgi:hypothetical protein
MTGYRNDEIVPSITTPTLDNPFVIPFREDGDKWYEKICHFTLVEPQWGMYDTGVVTSSGIGDGLYPLLVAMDNDKIVGMRLEYLGNSDEDLLDDEDDEEEEEFDNEENED